MPIWRDERGGPIPTRPCPRPGCGREVAVSFAGFRVEHLKHVGWRIYQVASFVNWCGHAQEIIPFPRPDGTVVPVPGEAS